jgi:hypothetical protein
MMKKYDTLVIGPVSLDHNIDHLGNERKEVGGAIIASGFAAANSGNRTALFTKFNPADVNVEEAFRAARPIFFGSPPKKPPPSEIPISLRIRSGGNACLWAGVTPFCWKKYQRWIAKSTILPV